MTRFSIVLLVALMVSALYLVRVQYESRRLFTEIDQARREARALETERRRLEVEKRAQATSLRVEKLATEKLAMRSITPAITEYVTLPQPTAGPLPRWATAPSGGSAAGAAAERGGTAPTAGPLPRWAAAPSGGSAAGAAAERGGTTPTAGPLPRWAAAPSGGSAAGAAAERGGTTPTAGQGAQP